MEVGLAGKEGGGGGSGRVVLSALAMRAGLEAVMEVGGSGKGGAKAFRLCLGVEVVDEGGRLGSGVIGEAAREGLRHGRSSNKEEMIVTLPLVLV